MAIVTELMPKGNLAQVRALFVLLFVGGGGGGIYVHFSAARLMGDADNTHVYRVSRIVGCNQLLHNQKVELPLSMRMRMAKDAALGMVRAPSRPWAFIAAHLSPIEHQH
jgi:hypothetical protein